MFELSPLEVLHQSVEIIPDFIHQLLPQGTSFGDDRIFPSHINLP